MNRNIVWFILVAAMSTLLNCASSSQMVPDPVENGNLIIGSLIFEIDGYQDNVAVIRRNIEVAIIGQVVVNGEMKSFGQWTTTDDNGYFYIANVPSGQFAIKGFRTHWIGLGDLILSRELIDPARNYFELKNADVLPMTGQLFDIAPHHRIVDFQHNIVRLHRNGLVAHQQYSRLDQIKLVTGELINSPSVASYFLEKFVNSGWESALRLHLK